MALPDPQSVVERVAERPAGARLLAALADPPLTGVHLVGGAVRDLLIGREPPEWDLVAEADGHAVADELRRRLGGEWDRVHERFGTASVVAGAALRFDVATARAEDYPRPGALPVVRPGSLADDMARRDFTVNAIAVGLSPDRLGLVHHADGALEDLAAARLRVLHAGSFEDDPTRLLRLARYAARLGFAVEDGTLALARAAVAAGAPATAGEARMGGELQKLLREEPAVAIDALAFAGGLGLYREVDEARMRRAVALLPAGGRADLLLLAALGWRWVALPEWLVAHQVPTPGIVLDAAADPEGLAAAMRGAAARPSALHALLRRRTVEAAALAGAFGAEDAARRWFDEVRPVKLRIGGEDLIRAGVAPGPEIGQRLDAALAHKLDEGAATPEEELAAALAFRP